MIYDTHGDYIEGKEMISVKNDQNSLHTIRNNRFDFGTSIIVSQKASQNPRKPEVSFFSNSLLVVFIFERSVCVSGIHK